MKISTKGEYGLRAIIDIAQSKEKVPATINQIAERQNISGRYLEQLMIPLKKAGLVKSIRGSQGGYILGRDAAKITVGDVVRILEGPIAPVECVNEVNPDDCQRADFCLTKVVWSKLRDAMTEVLDSYSIEDLIRESNVVEATDAEID
jgi:Rrf2 family cysteine metabolism transcriptional repressor